MNTQVTIIDPKEFGLEVKEANKMTSGLDVIILERKSLEVIYNQVILKELNAETFKEAKELLSKVRDNRTKGVEPWRKAQKELFLRGGQFVDAKAKVESLVNETMESKLDKIVKYEINLEIERKAALKKARITHLEPYGTDVQFIALDEMNEDQFDLLLQREKLAFVARIESAKIAEEKRIADEEIESNRIELERISELKRIEDQRIENENLKKDAAIKAKELAIERKKESEIQAKKDLEAKVENERLEKIAKEEKAKSDKLSAEIQKEKDDKLKAEQSEIKRLKDLSNAGDQVIFKDFYTTFNKVAFPELKNKEVSNSINEKLKELSKFMVEQSKKLL
jgi:hypothetical protein